MKIWETKAPGTLWATLGLFYRFTFYYPFVFVLIIVTNGALQYLSVSWKSAHGKPYFT